MKKYALIASAAAIGYAGKPAPEAPKMPEVPVDAPVAATTTKTRVAAEVTGIASLTLTLPETGRRGGQASAYPFASLEVGQFFGVKNKNKAGIAAAVTNANRKGKSEIDNGDGTTRTIQTRHYVAFDVTPEIAKQIEGTELAGSTALVQRDI